MDETLVRQIKIYCPEHQTTFEIVESPKIVCEIREHALSNDFPRAEFWEYCCDCQTFSPSSFGTGGKAGEYCLHCERKTARRFVCDECKIVAYDSGEETKGKVFNVNAQNGIEPSCSGCQKSFVGAKIYQHDCADIETILLTPRETCPFCKRQTLEAKAALAPTMQYPERRIQSDKISSNSSSSMKTISPSPNSTVSSAPGKPRSSKTWLPDSFNRHYEGKIGGQSFSMSLECDGRSLTGTVSTVKTDILIGTIDDDGNFKLDSFGNGNNLTGVYRGRIYPNGSIRGTRTNSQGGQGTSFFLIQQYYFRR